MPAREYMHVCMQCKTWRDTYSTLGHGGHFWTTRATCHTKRIQKKRTRCTPERGGLACFSLANLQRAVQKKVDCAWVNLDSMCMHVRCVVSLRSMFFDKWTKNWLGGSVTHDSHPTALDWILQSQFCRLSYGYHRLFDAQGSPMVHMANKYHQTLRRWSAIVWWLMVPPICCWNALCSPAMCAIQMYAVLWINLWS